MDPHGRITISLYDVREHTGANFSSWLIDIWRAWWLWFQSYGYNSQLSNLSCTSHLAFEHPAEWSWRNTYCILFFTQRGKKSRKLLRV